MDSIIDKDAELNKQIDTYVTQLQTLATKQLGKLEGYSSLERMAIITFTELQLATDLDLIPLMVRGKLLKKIKDQSLWLHIPGTFESQEEAVEQFGKLSHSEQHNISDLHDHIFPYVTSELGMSITQFWAEARNNSNVREVVPLLKAAITGEPSRSESVNAAVQRIQQEVGDDRQAVVREIISLAGNNSNTELRNIIRPDGTAPINFAVMRLNGAGTVIAAQVTEDQISRLALKHTLTPVNIREYSPYQIPPIKLLLKDNPPTDADGVELLTDTCDDCGGRLIRPDNGDPVECVVCGLQYPDYKGETSD